MQISAQEFQREVSDAYISAPPESVDLRIDKFLAGNETDLTRSQIHKLFDAGCVSIKGKQIKASYRLRGGEEIKLYIEQTHSLRIKPEPIKIDIVYEDNYVIVVNKPAGMVVHPAAGNWRGTLVNALLYHYTTLSSIGGNERPGIVHRLDKDTSGLLVVAKDNISHEKLSKQLHDRSMSRRYVAIVNKEMPNNSGKISAPIGRHPTDRKKMSVRSSRGRDAITIYNVLERFKTGYTLLELRLKTGRTHQIRVHLSYIGHPLIGDIVYGRAKYNDSIIARHALHATGLEFIHPNTGDRMRFTARLPVDFRDALIRISSASG